jgi:hypothetical protein
VLGTLGHDSLQFLGVFDLPPAQRQPGRPRQPLWEFDPALRHPPNVAAPVRWFVSVGNVKRTRHTQREVGSGEMTASLIARLVAAARIGFGVALVVAPERVTSLWLGSDAGRPGARVLTRGLGARDLALGVGALAAADSQLQPWVAAAIVADSADLVATVTAGKSLPLTGRAVVGAVAAGGAVLGTIALVGLRCGSPRV